MQKDSAKSCSEILKDPGLLRNLFAEFLGTCLFVFLGTGAVFAAKKAGETGFLGIALSFGFAISVLVLAILFFDSSGIHHRTSLWRPLESSRHARIRRT